MVAHDGQERVLGLPDSQLGLEKTALGGSLVSRCTAQHPGLPHVSLHPRPCQLLGPVPSSPADWRSHVQLIVELSPHPSPMCSKRSGQHFFRTCPPRMRPELWGLNVSPTRGGRAPCLSRRSLCAPRLPPDSRRADPARVPHPRCSPMERRGGSIEPCTAQDALRCGPVRGYPESSGLSPCWSGIRAPFQLPTLATSSCSPRASGQPAGVGPMPAQPRTTSGGDVMLRR